MFWAAESLIYLYQYICRFINYLVVCLLAHLLLCRFSLADGNRLGQPGPRSSAARLLQIIYTYIYTDLFVDLSLSLSIYIYIYVYVCVCVYIYIYIYISVYLSASRSLGGNPRKGPN